MNKFEKTLAASQGQVLDARSRLKSEDFKAAQEKIITDLEAKLRKLKRVILESQDLSIKTTTDLEPAKNIDADLWAQNMQKNSVELEILTRELSIAKANYSEWFVDESLESTQ